MKKKITIAFVISLTLFSFFCIFYDARLLPKAKNYSVKNENGKSLNISIYQRKKEKNDELILIFNDFKTDEVIIINSKWKLIGLVEGGRKEFKKIIIFLNYIKNRKNPIIT